MVNKLRRIEPLSEIIGYPCQYRDGLRQKCDGFVTRVIYFRMCEACFRFI